jgi:glycine/D-amino acid oxidase-like deaminating enzyme
VTPDRCEVLILGAGITGCALAYHLAERAIGPVVVYDPETPAAGATGRAAGIVTDQLWNSWDVEVARDSKAEYAALASRWDPSAYSVNGFVRWTHNPVAEPVLDEALARLHRWNVDVRRMEREELERRVPWGRFDAVTAAIGGTTDGVVTPSTMTEIYAEGARQRGVDLRLGVPFGSLSRSDGRWELSSGGSTLRATRVVVAAGAWSKRLLRDARHPVPLTPYRTQAAVLRPSSPSEELFPSVHDIDLDVYVRPESNGRILAGNGTEKAEADPERFQSGGDERFVTHIAESFAERFPGWADAELVRAWAGVCASTPDRRPLVGPIPGAEGLYVVAGFNGFGVMRAAGVAQRLARVLAGGEGRSAELELLEPVLPGRFTGPVVPFPPRPGFTLEAGDDPRF